MELKSITIQRFRSIVQANDISFSNYTVLVGKNNEGKTNIVSAISLAFRYFLYCGDGLLDRINALQKSPYREKYDFQVDYPVKLQNKGVAYLEKHPTMIELSFVLSQNEVNEFKRETKLTYSNGISINLTFSRNNSCEIWVKNRKKDSSNIRAIVNYINRRLRPTIIPTIRTSRQSMDIIERIVQNNLDLLRTDEKYDEAYELIKRMEEKRLSEISSNLLPTLSRFLPNISDVKIEMGYGRERYNLRRELDLVIDDGVLTSIENKGDGIKSLVQMALIKATSNNSGGLIIVEEPEAHLHSGAIHELNAVLREISNKQQVLITTHSSIFVNGYDYSSNILVFGGKCKPIKNLEELRKTLGVEISDSLFAADYVILVEGHSDKIIYNYLLSNLSPRFKELLSTQKIIFLETRGTTKAKTFMTLMQQLLIKYYCIWDNDNAGENAYKDGVAVGLIDQTNYCIIPQMNKNEAELEDMLNVRLLEKFVENTYNVTIDKKMKTKNKWSDRIKSNLMMQGKTFSSEEEEKIKNQIAEMIKDKEIEESINPAYKTFLENLPQNIISSFGIE